MPWPALPLDSWRDTRDTLQMYMQIAGKICLALTPRVNHFWNIAFRVVPHGLMSPTLHYGDRTFTMTFDLVEHRLVIEVSDGTAETVPLEPRAVADFYRLVMDALHRLEIDVRLWTTPVEVPDPIPFDKDVTHASYDDDAAHALLEVLLAITPPLEAFRAKFVGKCSPVHFFWGSFDLAVTRFSGRRAPERPGADAVTREAYSHEVISHGWWPGGGAVNEPAFYAYAAPEPEGLKVASVRPAAAVYNRDLGEFILPYEAVRSSGNPSQVLTAFLESDVRCGSEPGELEPERAGAVMACEHISAIKKIKTAKKHECEECVKIGSSWVHLRTCQTCGATLCCDSSPNRHASKHCRSAGHPVVASAEPGERWLYCFPDDDFAEY